MIYNRVLVLFAIAGALLDIAYYTIFAKDSAFDFLLNLITISIVSLYLFYSHSFAGGDCKLNIVLALLYPSAFYVAYGNSVITLVFAVAFAILAGYLYLLCYSIKELATKKRTLSIQYIQKSIVHFLKSYAAAMVYVVLLNCIFIIDSQSGISMNRWMIRCLCIAVAWCVGRYPLFKKRYMIIPALIGIVLFTAVTHVVPISLNPESYALVLILLLCQMIIRITIYENIPVEQLQKGMILSTFSSVLFQTSITKGLPPVSTEDLKSRLTVEEVKSIRIWAKATRTKELTIVKKIPFAIFISIGFAIYFILWSVQV